MLETEQFIFILTSAIALFSALIFILFSIFNFRKSLMHKAISFLFFSIFFHFLLTHLYLNGIIFEYPHLILVDRAAARLVLPLMFLMAWYSVFNKKFSITHLLHSIPFVLYLLDYHTIFMLSGEEKRTLLLQMEEIGYSVVLQKAAFFPAFLTNVLRIGIPLLYITGIGYLVFINRNFRRVPIPIQRFFLFLFFLLLFNIMSVVPGILSKSSMDSLFWMNSFGLIPSFVFLLAVFFQPGFLYGDGFREATPTFGRALYQSSNTKHLESDNSQSFPPSKQDLLFTRIESLFEKEKPYLLPDFSLRYLEVHLNISGRYISQSIKKNTGLGFKHYLQQKRMKYFYTEYQLKLGLEDKSTEEVAYDLGFVSVNTFYVQFKQATGMTPKEYFDRFIKQSTYRDETSDP
jgi:AraC-like DNA-binding protein